jgi:hypothetical protein
MAIGTQFLRNSKERGREKREEKKEQHETKSEQIKRRDETNLRVHSPSLESLLSCGAGAASPPFSRAEMSD